MSDSAIAALPMDRYHYLVGRLPVDACALCICDADGMPVRQSAELPAGLPRGMPCNDTRLRPVAQGHEVKLARYTKNASVAQVPLLLGAEQLRYSLVVILNRPLADIAQALQAEIADVLQVVAGYIQHDYSQQLAFGGLAQELAVRYEELNLLYGMDAPTPENQERETDNFKKLIRSCTGYLPLDLAALLLVDEDLSIVEFPSDISTTAVNAALDVLRPDVLRRVQETNESLVVNQDPVSDWESVASALSFKFVAVPVRFADRSVAGTLMFANGAHKPDFTNSDRKLCEVVAAEISKVIQSRRDPHTQLLNRTGFEERLTAIAERSEGTPLSLIYIDLDQFKVINDVAGHVAGDELIRQLATLIKINMNGVGTLARLGGDEFGVLVESKAGTETAEAIAEKLRSLIGSLRYTHERKLFDVSASIGVASVAGGANEFDTLLMKADVACNVAKEMGRNRVRVYQEQDAELAQHEKDLRWAGRIKQAIRDERFQLYAQTITPVQDPFGPASHYEILVRLVDEDGKLVPPGVFIPAAERYDVMSALDRWIIRKAIGQLTQFTKDNPGHPLSLSINLSGQSLCEDTFLDFVIDVITTSGVAPQSLCFEITETIAVTNLTHALSFIEKLRDLGCRFSLDDFGTGMSSFGYLKNLPVDYLKIDGSFVKSITQNPTDRAFVDAINSIGHSMGLQTIAEFVEDEAIIAALAEIGVDYAQGYGIDKPEPLTHKLERLLEPAVCHSRHSDKAEQANTAAAQAG